MGKYCYVASARRCARHLERGSGVSCRHAHSLFVRHCSIVQYITLHVYLSVRFIVYNKAGGSHRLTSLVEQFTRQLMQSPPDLLVIGGLRQLVAVDPVQGIKLSLLVMYCLTMFDVCHMFVL